MHRVRHAKSSEPAARGLPDECHRAHADGRSLASRQRSAAEDAGKGGAKEKNMNVSCPWNIHIQRLMYCGLQN